MTTDSNAAFNAARAICRKHAKSFYFASHFLPKEKRHAAYAVYAFCRLMDDAVDEADGDRAVAERRLDDFCRLLNDVYTGKTSSDGKSGTAIEAFAITVKQLEIPMGLFVTLADGCRMDLTIARYATWTDLENYCYHVAGIVGLIMSQVFRLENATASRCAVLMGNAMQLTNILRDVGEDLQRGRIYLPGEDLTQFGVDERQLATGTVDDNFRDLMRFEIDRARNMYRKAAEGLRQLPNDGSRFTSCAMAVIYSGILGAIERRNYDVFIQRARLTRTQKLIRLPLAWTLARRRQNEPVPEVFG